MVCPNCGQQIPDNSMRCNICGIDFHKGLSEKNTAEMNEPVNVQPQATEQQKINQLQEIVQQQQRQIERLQNRPAYIYYMIGILSGILSGVLMLIAPFMPYIVFNFTVANYSLLDYSIIYLIIGIVMGVGLIFDSLSSHGKSNIIIGILDFICCIYCYYQYVGDVKENNLIGLCRLGSGFFFLLFSSVLAIISGIFLIINNHRPNKKRKDG